MDLTDSMKSLNVTNQAPQTIENFAATIDNHHTEFIICYFDNLVTLIITQFGKVGNIYSVETEQVDIGFVDSEPVYNLRSLLGKDDIEVEAGVRYIAQELNLKKSLLVSLTLKDYERETIKLIVNAIKNYKRV